ncbi:MAG: helix-turn-helix domain-containing protein [Chloroflexi bacterium]|nr:helix-turn-helix domain-containing protein [Chloroflexota bacterium]
MMSEIEVLTTGEAAGHCHVSQATIVNWIRKGDLKAFVTPGGHRRILLSDFLSFLETYGMPVDSTLAALSRPRVLVVSDSSHAGTLVQALQGSGRFDAALAGDDYEACAQVARFEPDAVVLDTASTTLDCLAWCRWLRASSEGGDAFVLAMGDPEGEETALTAGADAYVPGDAVTNRLEAELITSLEAGRKE